MTESLTPVCSSCIHRVSETSCEAFDLIPGSIRVWAAPHSVPIEGQGNPVGWSFAPGTEEEFEDWKRQQESG